VRFVCVGLEWKDLVYILPNNVYRVFFVWGWGEGIIFVNCGSTKFCPTKISALQYSIVLAFRNKTTSEKELTSATKKVSLQ